MQLIEVSLCLRLTRVLVVQDLDEIAADLKTEASTRTIPADDWVLNEISAHVQRFGTGPGDVIVTNRLRKVAQRNAFGDRWRLAVADARTCGKSSASPSEEGSCGEICADLAHCLPKGTRFHDLRHFYASTLIAANLNPKVIQARLGHATITETMDTYGHLFPDAEDLGRGAIDTMFAVALTEQGRNQSTR
jgi:integrase